MADDANLEYGDRDVARGGEILRSVVGSGVHGIAIEGTDDHDEMGVYIEPPEYVLGFARRRDDYVWRTQPEGVPSGHGDTDLILYSLRKYLRLAVKGNPTVLLPLFAPREDLVVVTPLGEELREMRAAFLSQQAVERFLGYMRSQRARTERRARRDADPSGAAGDGGWNAKAGSHALRLALQGREIARTGTLTLPLAPPDRDRVLAVKRGEVPRGELWQQIAAIEDETRALLDDGRTPLPAGADVAAITAWAIDAQRRHWGW